MGYESLSTVVVLAIVVILMVISYTLMLQEQKLKIINIKYLLDI